MKRTDNAEAMTDDEFDEAVRRYCAGMRAHGEYTRAKAWGRAQDRQNAIKDLRELLNRDGFYAVLRRIAEGADKIKREDQLRILKMVDIAVQQALPRERRRGPNPKPRPAMVRPDPRTRTEKLQALAADPAASAGERAAAQRAIERLRQQPS
jgi:hypothetical protein